MKSPHIKREDTAADLSEPDFLKQSTPLPLLKESATFHKII